MRQILPFIFLCFALSLTAQTYLDSLPETPLAEPPYPGTPINVGYGTQDARSFNGTATHLESRQFNQGQINDWNQLWQARIPGYTVTRPGSNPNENFDARIRGLHNLRYGSTQPLYVVDGVPGVDISAVDPSDIVAIDVLRDAASTAIYGGRGSTGVVLITTKPSSTGALKIGYQGQVSVESAAKRFTLLDESQFVAYGGLDLSPGTVVNTDWQDQILQTAVSHAHHLTASKGLGHGFIKAGLHYRDVSGISKASTFEQYNASLLAEQHVWKNRLTLGAGGSLGQRAANYGFNEGYRYAISFNPSSPIRSDDAAYIPFGGYVENGSFDFFNPVALLEQNRNSGRRDFHLLHARAELALLPNLKAGVQVSEQTTTLHNLEYYSPYSKFRGAGVSGSGLADNSKSVQKTLESTLTYHFHRPHWQGDLLGGYGWYHNQTNGARITGVNLLDNTWQGKSWEQYRDMLKNFADPYNFFGGNSSYRSDRLLVAFFGRAQLSWRNTYFGTLSLRKEGSSNLAPAVRWGQFPAFSLGIDINQWMAAQPFDYFKISYGHGVTGTETTQSGLYQRTYGPAAKFYYNGQYIPSYQTYQNPNPQLGWERSTENSLNLNFSLWRGRLQAAANLYSYHSRDLIASVYKPIPPNFASSTIENVGETSGRGAELNLNYQLVKAQHFSWDLGIVATTAITTLESIYNSSDTITYAIAGQPCGCNVFLQVLYPGVTLGTFYGPVANGIDASGSQTFEDIDGNGYLQTDDYRRDQTNLGNAQPKWQLGIHQQLTWRNLDLNFLVQAVTGHKMVNYYRYAYEVNSVSSWNHIVTRYWDPALKLTRFNDRMVEDASFLRLQYVALGYNLKLKNPWLQSLHFQIGAQNLFTLSKYTGLDPDLRLGDKGPSDNGGRNYGFSDPLAPGIDRGGTYPTARRWWLGVEAAF